MSVAVSNVKDNKKALAKLRAFINDPNGDEPTDKFQNGKMSAVYAKAARKAKEEAERKRMLKESRNGKNLKKNNAVPKKEPKPKKGIFPTKKEECLPGLF